MSTPVEQLRGMFPHHSEEELVNALEV